MRITRNIRSTITIYVLKFFGGENLLKTRGQIVRSSEKNKNSLKQSSHKISVVRTHAESSLNNIFFIKQNHKSDLEQ